MTIFFVTLTDEPTRANHAVALSMVEQGDVTLFAANATRFRLHSEVQRNGHDRKIFAMSHGSEDTVVDAAGNAALSTADATQLIGYKIFSLACLTGRALGRDFAANGSTWWGYDTVINAPDERSPYSGVFSELLLVLKRNFPNAVDALTTAQVLAIIKDACTEAMKRLHELGASQDRHAMAMYSCCNEIWQHLCVWLAGESTPILHPDVPSSSIFG
ncbi:hypothetical protein [Rhizobium leguminosarum]|uniref:hypothetical protein n=1 Tax=Rhizobium leguminosarum TaxID=384 RepID=UPI001C9892EB|nr:hypothetical protein [Rhizobium leguminosarum]MBY5367823.1 hypothetical protein [Rhizobium leguminosarum]